MNRYIRAVPMFLLALAIGATAGPAVAGRGSGKHKANVQFSGVLTAITVDADPATTDTLTFRVLKANRHGRRWQQSHPGDVTVALAQRTRFSGPARLGRSASDYRVGDGVRVQARKSSDGSSLVARSVRLALQAYEGTLAAYDPATGAVALQWDDANRLAQDWLAAHGSPNPVTAAATASSKIERSDDGTPQTGDAAEMLARPTADGTALEVVKLEAEAPEA